jgi:hypothetical protein
MFHSKSKKKKTTTLSSVDLVGKFVSFMLVPYRERLFTDDFYSDSSLVQGLIRVKFLIFSRFVLALADGLCCAWLVYPNWCWYSCPEIQTSSIDWAQLSMFQLKTETESRNKFLPPFLS